MSVERFLLDTLSTAAAHGVHVRFNPNKYVGQGSQQCAGYFSSEPYPLLVTSGRDKGKTESWLSILVHETCHMDQWIENCDVWKSSYTKHGADRTAAFWDWLDGKRKTKRSITTAMRISRDIELDCERRAVKKIKKYNLPINIDNYIRSANVYLYLYTFMLESRKWEKRVYDVIDLSCAPKKFQTNYDDIPKTLLKEFRKLDNI